MADTDKVRVAVEKRGEANLRKLARVLIAIAEKQLNADEGGQPSGDVT